MRSWNNSWGNDFPLFHHAFNSLFFPFGLAVQFNDSQSNNVVESCTMQRTILTIQFSWLSPALDWLTMAHRHCVDKKFGFSMYKCACHLDGTLSRCLDVLLDIQFNLLAKISDKYSLSKCVKSALFVKFSFNKYKFYKWCDPTASNRIELKNLWEFLFFSKRSIAESEEKRNSSSC